MAYSRGGIYLANFNPSKETEAGKVRPCMVVQSDPLNQTGHPSTTVIPLTTNLIENAEPLRLRIAARDDLKQDSDLMLDQLRTLDNRRIDPALLTRVEDETMLIVERFLKILLGV